MAVVLLAAALALGACGDDAGDDPTDDATEAEGDTAEYEGSVSFATPKDGTSVASPVAMEFEVEGLDVQPAADGVEGAGHLHVIADHGCVDAGAAIGQDDGYNHFGDGSTSAELDLESGEHTLCLQFADNDHVATDITSEITITVE
jgi:hypothetical protein